MTTPTPVTALTAQQLPTVQAVASLSYYKAREHNIIDSSGDGVPHALLNLHALIAVVHTTTGEARVRPLTGLIRGLLDLGECSAPGLVAHLIDQKYPDAVTEAGASLTSLAVLDTTQDLLDWHDRLSLAASTWWPDDQPYPVPGERPTLLEVLSPVAELVAFAARALSLLGVDPQDTLARSFNA